MVPIGVLLSEAHPCPTEIQHLWPWVASHVPGRETLPLLCGRSWLLYCHRPQTTHFCRPLTCDCPLTTPSSSTGLYLPVYLGHLPSHGSFGSFGKFPWHHPSDPGHSSTGRGRRQSYKAYIPGPTTCFYTCHWRYPTLRCSTGILRPYVPLTLRRQIFDHLHGISHPGIRATQRLIASKYVWPSMNKDVRHWTRTCQACQRAKVQFHTTLPIGRFHPPDARFDHVHVDLVGPLPPVHGYTHLLTCVDRFTRWPEAIPLTNTSTETVAQAFLFGWIARFGVPSSLTSDRGGQFESHLWEHLMKLLGISRVRTTAYHPSANGVVERFHRQLKASLMCKAPTNWFEALPVTLLGIRSTLKEDLHCTSAELVYGTTLRLPGDFFQASTPTDMVEDPLSYVDRLKSTGSPTFPRTCHLHHMCLFSATQSNAPCNHLMMAPTRYSSVLPSTTQSTSIINIRPFPLTGWSLPSWRILNLHSFPLLHHLPHHLDLRGLPVQAAPYAGLIDLLSPLYRVLVEHWGGGGSIVVNICMACGWSIIIISCTISLHYFLYHIPLVFPVCMRIYFLFRITCLVYTIPFIPLCMHGYIHVYGYSNYSTSVIGEQVIATLSTYRHTGT